MNLAELHRRACERFGEHVQAVRPDQWDAATPCTDWDVRALVNHVVGEDLWTAPLMAGATIAEVGDKFDGDVVGADPAAAYADAAEAAVAAVSADGALDRTVHLSFGDVPGEEYAWQLFADHLIHGWDLARAIGADDRLDPDLVAACAGWYAKNEEIYRSGGAVAQRPDVPAGADQQTILLAAFGRRNSHGDDTR
jgi:uncharacterized protein (TIGR03086 family)